MIHVVTNFKHKYCTEIAVIIPMDLSHSTFNSSFL